MHSKRQKAEMPLKIVFSDIKDINKCRQKIEEAQFLSSILFCFCNKKLEILHLIDDGRTGYG